MNKGVFTSQRKCGGPWLREGLHGAREGSGLGPSQSCVCALWWQPVSPQPPLHRGKRGHPGPPQPPVGTKRKRAQDAAMGPAVHAQPEPWFSLVLTVRCFLSL